MTKFGGGLVDDKIDGDDNNNDEMWFAFRRFSFVRQHHNKSYCSHACENLQMGPITWRDRLTIFFFQFYFWSYFHWGGDLHMFCILSWQNIFSSGYFLLLSWTVCRFVLVEAVLSLLVTRYGVWIDILIDFDAVKIELMMIDAPLTDIQFTYSFVNLCVSFKFCVYYVTN